MGGKLEVSLGVKFISQERQRQNDLPVTEVGVWRGWEDNWGCLMMKGRIWDQ